MSRDEVVAIERRMQDAGDCRYNLEAVGAIYSRQQTDNDMMVQRAAKEVEGRRWSEQAFLKLSKCGYKRGK